MYTTKKGEFMQESIVRTLGIISVVTVSLIMLMILTACGAKPKVSNQDDQIRALQRQLEQQLVALNTLNDQYAALIAQSELTDAEVDGLQVSLDIVQENVNSLLVDVAVLQGYKHIEGMVDPCGNHPSKVDEVLLRLSTGELLVSYSDTAAGLNTRFAVLGNGTYGTTDGTNCTFTVNNGVVSW